MVVWPGIGWSCLTRRLTMVFFNFSFFSQSYEEEEETQNQQRRLEREERPRIWTESEAEPEFILISHWCCPSNRRREQEGEKRQDTSAPGALLLPPTATNLEAKCEEKKILAAVRWKRVKAYISMCSIFRQIWREQNRDPTLSEFIGHLQFCPYKYNWRRPTPDQLRQLARWRAGLDDPRLCDDTLFRRTSWLAGGMRRYEIPRKSRNSKQVRTHVIKQRTKKN